MYLFTVKIQQLEILTFKLHCLQVGIGVIHPKFE